ncbi:MAG: DUF1778 domain-containing protein [Acidobacteriota bacterium]|nr:DUF1778 domain-containing protein [Acidobacteriota bacterium]
MPALSKKPVAPSARRSVKRNSAAAPRKRKPATAKRGRLEARIDAGQKSLIERAAQIQGRSLSDFVIASVQEAATRVIQQASVIALSARASRHFAAALLNPAPPNAAMRRAATRHQALLRM